MRFRKKGVWTDGRCRALFKDPVQVQKGRHPLLFDKAVPIDIECGDQYRILVITGPNTGGKTVALKTAGVCAILGWMGFPIPAAEGSVLGVIGGSSRISEMNRA